MSTIWPMRKPMSNSFLTQALTRQPVRSDGHGSAARMRPSFNAALNSANSSKSAAVYVPGFCSKRRSMSACNADPPQQTNRLEDLLNARQAGGQRRAERKPVNRLEQPHQTHRGLHRDRIRFDEVDIHQRQVAPLQLAGRFEIVFQAGWNELRHLAGDLVGDHRNQAPAPK